jgi:hypothetical protein
MAGAVAIATLLGTSAFAETRHSDATERDRSRQSSDHRANRDGRQSRDRRDNNTNNQAPAYQQRDARATAPQTFDRHNFDRHNNDQTPTYQQRDARATVPQTFDRRDSRSNGRYDNRSQADNFRNRGNDRSGSFHNDRPAFDDHGRRSDFVHGRVNRFVHERGGYRIWVDGGRFPVWIPEARISLFPHLRVGLSIGLGGYYDPRGYLEAYDYYDGGYYGGGQAYSSGLLRGVVETVDYRRGTLVIRDDVSGSFVTTLIRDRRLETLRPGDYAEISGDWTRSGVFEGLRLEDADGGRY